MWDNIWKTYGYDDGDGGGDDDDDGSWSGY
jgi:hypothetical protein